MKPKAPNVPGLVWTYDLPTAEGYYLTTWSYGTTGGVNENITLYYCFKKDGIMYISLDPWAKRNIACATKLICDCVKFKKNMKGKRRIFAGPIFLPMIDSRHLAESLKASRMVY